MEDASERIRRWAKAGEDTALPDWNELPTIPLYMDQVIFTWGKPAFFERDGQSSLLTSSMVNNYVKTGVLPILKKRNTEGNIWPHFWPCVCSNRFCPSRTLKPCWLGRSFLKSSITCFSQRIRLPCRRPASRWQKTATQGENLKQKALRLAIEAYAKRAAAERILCELGRDTAEAGKPEKKRQEAE